MPETREQDLPGLSVGAVARRLGVSPSTLRTWDRRYGIGPGDHTGGAHRRYSVEDLARLLHMQQLVRAGVRVGDAADAARTWEPQREHLRGAVAAEVEPVAEQDYADRDDLVRGLSSAASALDARASGHLIRKSLDSRGVVWTWDEVLRPVLASVGRIWERNGTGVDVEHMLSHVASTELAAVVARESPRSPRPALLACAPGEDHCLPLHAVAAALAERGMESRVLGARMPTDGLASAARRLGPSSVLVWAYLPVADANALLDLPKMRPEPLIVAAGPGWPQELPPEVARATDLSNALTRLLRAA